jgi:predicted RNase H-like nuclease
VRFAGVDLAWKDGVGANETGLALLDPDGTVADAGWARGVDAVAGWLDAIDGDVLAFVDAPLIVTNPSGQRRCETEVGRRYGKWKVSANSSNLGSPRLAGVALLRALDGWAYDDGSAGPPTGGRRLSETYPYTTLVGVEELGYDVRPLYKRKPRTMPVAAWRPVRAANCDELVRRLGTLVPLDSHPVTAALRDPSPADDTAYKHREDLIDALLAAWTARLWAGHGFARCQVLGDPPATIIAPARPEQRRPDGAR